MQLEASNKSLEEANEKLKVHDRLQKEFINIAAHELRTPVQPLLGVAELLNDQLAKGAGELKVTKAELEMIVRNAKRLERLSSDILDVSRIGSLSLNLQTETVDLNEKIQ